MSKEETSFAATSVTDDDDGPGRDRLVSRRCLPRTNTDDDVVLDKDERLVQTGGRVVPVVLDVVVKVHIRQESGISVHFVDGALERFRSLPAAS